MEIGNKVNLKLPKSSTNGQISRQIKKSTPSYSGYQSPLASRYASAAILQLFSPQRKFETWRQIWIALAQSQMELGLPVRQEQINELKKYSKDINFELAEQKERELRHDVMAHIHTYGEQCPSARPILHLGATSCTITDNADLMIFREGLQHLTVSLANVCSALGKFAKQNKGLATLAFTHLQPAQCTSVGKRATLWLQDLLFDLQEIETLAKEMPALGAKGTTGTQASFLRLFNGDSEKVRELDQLFVEKLGFTRTIAVSGQTYPRKIDDRILCALSRIAQSASKFASDIRILAHRREIEEPFAESSQVGSSAMPYKQNPMLCERMTAIARFVMSLPANTAATAAQQWFERTLDDSANRRIVMVEAFLAADSILNIYLKVAGGLRVHPEIIRRNVEAELPFMATEELLMEAVKAGGDRQELHERIRVHSIAAAKEIKKGEANDLLERLSKDKKFASVLKKIPALIQPHVYFGRAPEQVEEFLKSELDPALASYRKQLGRKAQVKV